MKAYYASRAPIYEEVYTRPERQADLAFLKYWVPAVFRDRNVLEVACGTGFWTRLIATQAKSLTATDAVAETLAFAKQSTANEVTFLVADALKLPDNIGMYDSAFAGLWVSHIPKRQFRPFVEGLHQRLIDDAIVVFLDNTQQQLKTIPITEKDEHGDTYQLRTLPDGETHRVLKNFPTQDELFALIEGIGKDAEYRQLDHFWVFKYRATTR